MLRELGVAQDDFDRFLRQGACLDCNTRRRWLHTSQLVLLPPWELPVCLMQRGAGTAPWLRIFLVAGRYGRFVAVGRLLESEAGPSLLTADLFAAGFLLGKRLRKVYRC